MKKSITMLFVLMMALMLECSALAQEYYTLPEIREQAASGWHETYTDKVGRTIPVDVEIRVYGEDVVPILRTEISDYKLDSGLLSGVQQWSDGKQGVGIYHNNPADAIFKTVRGEKTMIVHRVFGEKIDMDAVYKAEYGASITPREMTEYLTGILEAHGIEASNYLFDEPFEFSMRCRMKKDTMEVTEPAAYFMHFWPTMVGLPILGSAGNAYEKGSGMSYMPQMVLTMRNQEEYSISVNALVETERLTEDVPLCSVETVKQRIEQEIESGHVREVFGIRLGYVVCNDPENPPNTRRVYEAKSYYLVPMWVVDCIYMDSAKKEYSVKGPASDELTAAESTQPERKWLMINAQTGKLLDRNDRSLKGGGNTNYQGFISWDDVK